MSELCCVEIVIDFAWFSWTWPVQLYRLCQRSERYVIRKQSVKDFLVWGLVFDVIRVEWELMPVMVRVEKFKNLQNKACLPPFLCYLLCPGYFGGDFLIFSIPERKNKEITSKVPRQALFCKFLNYQILAPKPPPLGSPAAAHHSSANLTLPLYCRTLQEVTWIPAGLITRPRPKRPGAES